MFLYIFGKFIIDATCAFDIQNFWPTQHISAYFKIIN